MLPRRELTILLLTGIAVSAVLLPLRFRFGRVFLEAPVLNRSTGAGKVAVAFDVDNDGGADLLSFGAGEWSAKTLGGIEGPTTNVSGVSGREVSFLAGRKDGVPVPGDYNGDGVTDLATYSAVSRSSAELERGIWKIHFSDLLSAEPRTLLKPGKERTILWGGKGAKAVPADYDGDGTQDIAVFHAATGMWQLLLSSGGFNVVKASLGDRNYGLNIQWGLATDVPLPGDYDGDGKADLMLWRKDERDGLGKWLFSTLPISAAGPGKREVFEFGRIGDIPVPGDYSCDGAVDLAVYRPSEKKWLIRFPKGKLKELSWGLVDAQPFVADFDGDGCADPAFFKDGSNFSKNSSDFSKNSRAGSWHIRSSRLARGFEDIVGNAYPAVLKYSWEVSEAKPVQLLIRNHGKEGIS